MKGQKLHVRRASAEDADALTRFSADQKIACTAEHLYIGKIVGEIVALLAADVRDTSLLVLDLFVAPDLRGLHIARKFLQECGRMAEAKELQASAEHPLASYLLKIGFIRDGESLRRPLQTG